MIVAVMDSAGWEFVLSVSILLRHSGSPGASQPSAAPAILHLSQPRSPYGVRESEGGWSPHRWWHPGHICPADRCSWQQCLFQGVISIFFSVEEDKVDSRDTQPLPQAALPELLFSAAISSHFKQLPDSSSTQ